MCEAELTVEYSASSCEFTYWLKLCLKPFTLLIFPVILKVSLPLSQYPWGPYALHHLVFIFWVFVSILRSSVNPYRTPMQSLPLAKSIAAIWWSRATVGEWHSLSTALKVLIVTALCYLRDNCAPNFEMHLEGRDAVPSEKCSPRRS